MRERERERERERMLVPKDSECTSKNDSLRFDSRGVLFELMTTTNLEGSMKF